MQLWHLHPFTVHFPIALLLMGCGLHLLNLRWRQNVLQHTVRVLLAAGLLGLLAAIPTGLLAYKTAPHIPDAWEVQAEHKRLGFWTLATGMGLVAASIWRTQSPPSWVWHLETVLWLTVAALVLATAWHGGQLVFIYGTGVLK